MTCTAIPKSLSLAESEHLSRLESIIARNLQGFYEVGTALLEIRDKELYRETHETFDAYCRKRWDLSYSHAARLIKAAAITDNLKSVGSVLPVNERQVRPLTRLSPRQQREAWQEAVETAPGQRITGQYVKRVVRRYVGDAAKFASVIKPSDNWNFSQVEYEREDENRGYGYIPGDVYANCFWYYVQPGSVVVDPMAAAGMAQVVYDDRARWMNQHRYDFDLRLFDLTPQAPCVIQHNLLLGFPVERADYIFLDPPYYGIAHGQYSHDPQDLANMSLEEWVMAVSAIAQYCARAQQSGGLCSVISPNFRDIKERRIVLMTDIVTRAWVSAGYQLYDKAYASRRIQQKQNTRMAAVNNAAKENKTMLTDIAEILTFRRHSSAE